MLLLGSPLLFFLQSVMLQHKSLGSRENWGHHCQRSLSMLETYCSAHWWWHTSLPLSPVALEEVDVNQADFRTPLSREVTTTNLSALWNSSGCCWRILLPTIVPGGFSVYGGSHGWIAILWLLTVAFVTSVVLLCRILLCVTSNIWNRSCCLSWMPLAPSEISLERHISIRNEVSCARGNIR